MPTDTALLDRDIAALRASHNNMVSLCTKVAGGMGLGSYLQKMLAESHLHQWITHLSPAETVVQTPAASPPVPCGVRLKADGTPYKKPGPKPGAKAKARADQARATEGLRAVASGLRPKIKDAMAIVMGTAVMNATSVHAGLEERNWLPNAQDPVAYIRFLLSSAKTCFVRCPEFGQGFYRVRTPADAPPSVAVVPPVQAPVPPAPLSDAQLEDLVLALLQDGKGHRPHHLGRTLGVPSHFVSSALRRIRMRGLVYYNCKTWTWALVPERNL